MSILADTSIILAAPLRFDHLILSLTCWYAILFS